MTDTHRSNEQTGPIETILRAAFPTLFDLGKIGEKTPEVRDALNTQTTPPNSAMSVESVAAVLRALHAERQDDEAPTGWREWYTEALEHVAERLALPNDSGKSGTTAAKPENGGTGSADAPNDAVRAAIADAVEAMGGVADAVRAAGFHLPKPHVFPFDESAHFAAVGELKEEGEDEPDPTPEQQAATFQAITAEPRPSAVAIKAALERGEECIGWALSWGVASGDTVAFDIRAMLGMLDRLGIHCLALEIERDGLAAQLDRIADQAKPIDGTDLAELVQAARLTSGRLAASSMTFSRAAVPIIDRLIAAVNDQGRRLREAEAVQHPATGVLLAESAAIVGKHTLSSAPLDLGDVVACLSRTRWALIQAIQTGEEAAALLAEAYPAVRLVNDWATWEDSSLYAYADAILAKYPAKPKRDSIVDALDEIRSVARGRLGDNGFTIPPTYDDAARDKAAEKAREIWPGLAMRDGWHVVVDGIAKTLGLVRAQ